MKKRAPSPLYQLAEAAGLQAVWEDAFGDTQQVDESVLRDMLGRLHLPSGSDAQIRESLAALRSESVSADAALVIGEVGRALVFPYTGPLSYEINLDGGGQVRGVASVEGPGLAVIAPLARPGYHRLSIGARELTLAVAPQRCPSVADCNGTGGGRAWGVAVQAYGLRRNETNPQWQALHGAGDYTLVGQAAAAAARHGASALAISPVHAMFSAAPERYSPYSPSSRLFLNAAYIDPAAVLGGDAMLAALRDEGGGDAGPAPVSDYIDWPDVVQRRLQVLRRMYVQFCHSGPEALLTAYRAYRSRSGEALESHARYEALHAMYSRQLGPENGWGDWPAALQDPRGAAAEDYAAAHGEEVGFHAFLQWLADEGLAEAQQAARHAGMGVGLIADLAIGTDPRGSHAWSRKKEILVGVSVGAPPDLYQAQGQNWGLTAFSPRALQSSGYAAFIETLRAALAHAGGIRIDHILGLARMWVIADGAQARRGVYLRYPLDDMLRLVALEAWRHKAIVIGENLGTVPPGFNEKLEEKGIMGMSVLWFEQKRNDENGAGLAYTLPADWPASAMATTTTHDLPTVEGWWAGRDLAWRERLGEAGETPGAQQARAQREQEKTALWRALQAAGCTTSKLSATPEAAPRDEILSFVSSAPSALCVVPVEDLLGLSEQPNLPGPPPAQGPGHPNWVQRLPVPVDQLFDEPSVQRSVAAVIHNRNPA